MLSSQAKAMGILDDFFTWHLPASSAGGVSDAPKQRNL
jgi:hypothetical protein